MYCPECGKQNNDGAKFCCECGKALAQKEKKNSIFDELLQNIRPEEEALLKQNFEEDDKETNSEYKNIFEMVSMTKERETGESYGAKIQIVGHTIHINKGFDVVNTVKKQVKQKNVELWEEFVENYFKTVQRNDTDMVKNCINLYVQCIEKMVDCMVISARDIGVTLDKEMFLTELYSKYFDVTEYIMPFLERYMEIAQEFGIDEGIRELQVLATGNFIGGGRSIGGAIVGSITAKMLSAATKYSVNAVLKTKNQIVMRNAIYQLMRSEAECFGNSLEACGKSILKLFIEEASYQGVEIESLEHAKITVVPYEDKILEQQIFGKIKQILKTPYKEKGFFELYGVLKKNGKNIQEAESITRYFGMDYCIKKYKTM